VLDLSKPEKPEQLMLVVRIRGTVNVRRDMRGTLDSLRLHRVHAATLFKGEPNVLGALQNVKDLVAWGEVDEGTLVRLLEKRARLVGDRHVAQKYLKDRLGARDFKELAESLLAFKADWAKLPGVKPFFRLSPPKSGYHVKLERSRRGKSSIVGYLGKEINGFVLRMI